MKELIEKIFLTESATSDIVTISANKKYFKFTRKVFKEKLLKYLKVLLEIGIYYGGI
jgi:hypothetical protein